MIVEGKVVSIPPAYWGGQMIYTSYVVQVYKIFKGGINTTFIEIPLEGGIVGNDILSIPSCGTLSLAGLGQTGIFFLNNPNISDSTANKNFLVQVILLQRILSFVHSMILGSIKITQTLRKMFTVISKNLQK